MAAPLEDKVFTCVLRTVYCTKLFVKPQKALGTVHFQCSQQARGHWLSTSWIIPWLFWTREP